MQVRRILVRGSIVVFLSAFIGALIFIVFVGDSDSDVLCYDAANEVEKNPSVETVSAFMNVRTDGASSYLHLALFGRLFAHYPDIFRKVYETEDFKNHLYFQNLQLGGNGIFEYYPHLEPKVFEEVYLKSEWISDKK